MYDLSDISHGIFASIFYSFPWQRYGLIERFEPWEFFSTLGFLGYLSSIRQCFLGLLGDFDLDIYIEAPYPLPSVALLILYVVVVTILLLNLLIAMMGDTYADVKKGAKKLWSVSMDALR